MAFSAGERLVAGRVPGERLATDTVVANSSAITTTETEVQTVTASLVSGRTYRVVWDLGFHVSVTTDHHFARIREDNSSGTQLQGRRLSAGTTAQNYPARLEAEYTAASSGSKTFSATLQRSGGTGNVTLAGSSTTPTRFYVEYVSG